MITIIETLNAMEHGDMLWEVTSEAFTDQELSEELKPLHTFTDFEKDFFLCSFNTTKEIEAILPPNTDIRHVAELIVMEGHNVLIIYKKDGGATVKALSGQAMFVEMKAQDAINKMRNHLKTVNHYNQEQV